MLTSPRLPMATYGSMAEVCQQFGLTPRAIRHYEALGLISTVRDRQNYRRFDARARTRLQLIADFRRAGLSLDDIREILDNRDDATGQVADVDCALAKLLERRRILDQARRSVDAAMAALQPPRRFGTMALAR
jgi:DNA-binding transcriptional MerR regulator